jgi:hypothetical protein
VSTDREFIAFCATLADVAEERFSASCEGEGSEAFCRRLFEEYAAAGKTKDVRRWLAARLEGEFVWVAAPPVWVEDEPSWPFEAGRPMVFVAQLSLEKGPVTEKHLAWNEELYLFGSRVPSSHVSGKHEMKYKIVVQYRD